jgi:hypothetical protein
MLLLLLVLLDCSWLTVTSSCSLFKCCCSNLTI